MKPDRWAGLLAVACVDGVAYPSPVAAQAQPKVIVTLPPLDLGQTSFLDGEAGPGGLLEIIGNGATAG